MHTQEEMKQIVLPLLKTKGEIYQKVKKIFARKAKQVETITTATSDGKETINRAHPGDYIVKNQTDAGEEYILTPEKFHPRYTFKKRAKAGFSEYEPTGRIYAMEVNQRFLRKFNVKNRFYFMASWGSKMVVKEKDFLACPVGEEEVYRIARKEFFETYERC
ncbi:MAG TPA: hypothetical protein ENJ53_08415 [Phaeodactylibacter sp.]|nr:hypothetical protein [Phaeodactylibacter sp.]